MEPSDMRDAYGAFGRVVNMAIRAARHSATAIANNHSERERADAFTEAVTIMRVIATLIDPHLYEGSRYGMLRGNRVWGALFARVRLVIEHGATFDEYDEGAVRGACYTLANIADAWTESERAETMARVARNGRPE